MWIKSNTCLKCVSYQRHTHNWTWMKVKINIIHFSFFFLWKIEREKRKAKSMQLVFAFYIADHWFDLRVNGRHYHCFIACIARCYFITNRCRERSLFNEQCHLKSSAKPAKSQFIRFVHNSFDHIKLKCEILPPTETASMIVANNWYFDERKEMRRSELFHLNNDDSVALTYAWAHSHTASMFLCMLHLFAKHWLQIVTFDAVRWMNIVPKVKSDSG